MPVGRQLPQSGPTSHLWPSGGVHLWPSGGTSSAHSHPRGHLVYAAGGVLSVCSELGTSIVPANRVAWTPGRVTHYHRAHGQTDMRILFLPTALARLVPGHPAVFMVSDLAREILLTLTGPRNYDTAAGDWERAALGRLRRVLVDELHEAREQPLQLPEPHDDRLQAIARMLYEQPADNTSLAGLGQAIGASARTLSRLFGSELGMTFYQWRTQLRVYHALVLLADGHDTTYVAHACGWANPSSFIAAFTNIVGTTPGRYRAGHQHSTTPGAAATAYATPGGESRVL
jgi:AraC-like DNA-binding protein